jgi:(p)ppGpp synthase/HD superfamily hydrolase
MAGGRVATFPLSTAPVFEDKDCTLPLETATEDFEADDFLAEIQREEAEQAAAIKRALEEEKKQREAEKKESEDKKKKKKKTTKKKKGTKSEL